MRTLRQKIIVFTTLSVVFLLFQLVLYTYNILLFKKEFFMLERAHSFMEDVLELRRYEKNFLYGIDHEDVKMVLSYIDRIKKEVKIITEFPVKKEFYRNLIEFNKNIVQYEKLVNIAVQTQGKEYFEKIREYGHEMVTFAEKLLEINRDHVNKRLTKIVVVVAVPMFLFGGVLIIFIVYLAVTILKQLSFIQQTTQKIAHGDFNYIPESDSKGQAFPLIIKAFNRMVKELEHRQEQLIQAKKLASLGTLTSGIAHEINNPLNNILLTAESILEDFDELNKEEIEEMIVEILQEVRRASSVVKNLLDFSRRRSRGEFELLDLSEVIGSILKLLKNQLMLSGIQLKEEIPKDLPPIKGDLDSLKQVFINLFLNAIQAMPEGGVLAVAIYIKEDMLEVQVKDTGIGMTHEIMEQIFDPFFSTKPVGKGTGLGLSIVYGLVKKHGGTVEVKSIPKQGTTFFVYFPIAK